MDFWLVSALLTFIAILIVMLPLTRANPAAQKQGDKDRSVYIQQLKEVDADLSRGLLDEQSAEQARLEISRRILKEDRKKSSQATAIHGSSDLSALGSPARWSFIAILVLIPAVSWGLYAYTGMPDMPSQPLSERNKSVLQDKSAGDLIAQAEAHLSQSPDDGRGWAVLAPIYLRMGRVDDAINAYQQAMKLLGDDSDRLIGLGEALVIKANGQVTAQALEIFKKAAQLDPSDLRPVLLQARALIQAGDKEGAIASLQNLLSRAPQDTPWRADIEQTIASLQGQPGGNPASAPADVDPQFSGPSAADIEAAAALDEQGRKDMIRSMVDGLAAKLHDNPDDVAGWERLLRAYVVLGEQDNAMKAYNLAAKSLSENDINRLKENAGQLGLTITGRGQ